MMKKVAWIIIACLFCLIWPSGANNNSYAQSLIKIGNASSNLANDGLIAVSGNWIYYINTDDNNAIYKKEKDSSKSLKINSNRCWHLNVVDDWVYYLNSTGYRGQFEEFDLYKMKTDGTKQQKIKLATKLEENSKIIVMNDWIYIRNLNEFYRIKTDGTRKQNIKIDSRFKRITDFTLTQNGECIYIADSKTIVKCDSDLKNHTILYKHDSTLFNIIIDSDYIYFNDNDSGKRLSIDDKSVTELLKGGKDGQYFLDAIGGSDIYLHRENHDRKYFYKISKNLDGLKEVTVLTDHHAKDINIAYDSIYYINNSGILKSAKLDGTGTINLYNNIYNTNVSRIVENNGVVYFDTVENGRQIIRSIQADGTNPKVICDLSNLHVDDWILIDGHIYCNGDEIADNEYPAKYIYSDYQTTGNHVIYDIPVLSGVPKKIIITQEELGSLYYFKNGWFYFYYSSSLKRISLNGSIQTMVPDLGYVAGGASVVFSSDCIYFVKGSDQTYLYKINYDGSKLQKISISKFSIDSLIVSGGYVYFDDGKSYVKRSLKSGSSTVISNSITFRSAKLNSNKIYYTSFPKEGIYMFDLSSKKEKLLIPGDNGNVIGISNSRIVFTHYRSLECLCTDDI